MSKLSFRLAIFAAVACTALTLDVPAAAAAPVPPGVSAGIAVFDRQANTFTEQQNDEVKFRSASVVKLLIALDYLWTRGPSYPIPAADRVELDAMLRDSKDDAASMFWARNGYDQVITRMVPRLKLKHTDPPAQRGMWGYTATSPADTVRVYQYILDTAAAPVRDFIMNNLRQSTRCAEDGFDQHFGIPRAFARPWAVKPGWSGFGARGDCSGRTPNQAADSRPALHTTGTVGPDDRSIVAVLTLHPAGTTFDTAATTVTELTRSLKVNGAEPAAGTWFETWGSGVNVRPTPSTEHDPIGAIPAGARVLVKCQKSGEEVVIGQYRNQWWAYLPQFGGYITNIYVKSPGNKLPNVSDCPDNES